MNASRWVLLTFLLVSFGACSGRKGDQGGGERGQAVARIDQTTISIGEIQEQINRQSPFIRARYTSIEKKKEFLDNRIRFEVMAREAERRGYDKDPEVVRAMKQQMISRYLQKDFDAKLKPEDVPDAEVEKYFNEHSEEFNQPERVRISQILTKVEAKAKKAQAEAKAAPKADQKAFRDLVTKYSEDEDSKPRGGDLTFIDRKSTAYPPAFIEAAFALVERGDVSPVIKTDKGYHVLQLTQRQPAVSRTIAEVKRTIQQKLHRDVRAKAMDDLVVELRKKTKVEIYDDMLAKVAVETGPGAGDPSMPPQMPPQMPPPGAVPPPPANPAPAAQPAK